MPEFRTYLDIVERMLTASNHELYIGRVLHAADPPARTAILANSTRRHALTAGTAAALFAMNIRTWKTML